METGYYKKIEKTIHHDAILAVEEVSHLEVVKVYENGGKDVKKVIDVPAVEGKPTWDEITYEEVWVDYTPKELAIFRIKELKQLLAQTDYRAIKYAEGCYAEQEYSTYKAQRQTYRNEINQLEQQYNIKPNEE